MMKLIRWFLGKLILTLDAAFPPRSLPRSEAAQKQVDQETRALALYQFEACPFCVKVRREIRRLGLAIEIRDAKNATFADELLKGGGQLQVPCLRISEANGKVRWVYESSDINSYLESRFGQPVSS